MEIFKDIKGYEGYYQISNLGNVKSLKYNKNLILKKELSKGYYRFNLCLNNKTKHFLAHRLVAINFIDNKLDLPCVNHIDGNKLNNNSSNLEWCSHSENEIHSYKVLNKINPIRKLDLIALNDIKENAKKGVFPFNKVKGNIKMFSQKYNVNVSTIHNVLNNKYYV